MNLTLVVNSYNLLKKNNKEIKGIFPLYKYPEYRQNKKTETQNNFTPNLYNSLSKLSLIINSWMILMTNIATLLNVVNITGRLIKKWKQNSDPILIAYYKHQKQDHSPIIECEGCDLDNTNEKYSGLYKFNCIIELMFTQTAVILTCTLQKCQNSKLSSTNNFNIKVKFFPIIQKLLNRTI